MSRPQKRLGRGISTLISADLATPAGIGETGEAATKTPILDPSPATHRVIQVSLDRIRPNPSQPRRHFDEPAIRGLADSIKERGALQPIIVRPSGNGFELVAGERRLRAAKIAGLSAIPAIARTVSDDEMLELALVENVQRADLNPIERARAYQKLNTHRGLSHEQIARKMGEDRATVSNYIRLLSLVDDALELVASGELSPGHGKALLGVSDPIRQAELAKRTQAEGWSVRRLESAARIAGRSKAGPQSPAPTPRPAIADMQRRLSQALGSRVRIREGRRAHSGRIEVEYKGLREFDRITSLLGVAPETAE